MQCLCCIGTSSQMITSVCFKTSWTSEPFLIAQNEFSNTGIGMWKHEWEVCPPVMRRDETPEEPTHRATLPFALTAAATALHTKVFPPPPALCKKRHLLNF